MYESAPLMPPVNNNQAHAIQEINILNNEEQKLISDLTKFVACEGLTLETNKLEDELLKLSSKYFSLYQKYPCQLTKTYVKESVYLSMICELIMYCSENRGLSVKLIKHLLNIDAQMIKIHNFEDFTTDDCLEGNLKLGTLGTFEYTSGCFYFRSKNGNNILIGAKFAC